MSGIQSYIQYEASKNAFATHFTKHFLLQVENMWAQCTFDENNYNHNNKTAILGGVDRVEEKFKQYLQSEECFAFITQEKCDRLYKVFLECGKAQGFAEDEVAKVLSLKSVLLQTKRAFYEYLSISNPRIKPNVSEQDYALRKCLLFQTIRTHILASIDEQICQLQFTPAVVVSTRAKRATNNTSKNKSSDSSGVKEPRPKETKKRSSQLSQLNPRLSNPMPADNDVLGILDENGSNKERADEAEERRRTKLIPDITEKEDSRLALLSFLSDEDQVPEHEQVERVEQAEGEEDIDPNNMTKYNVNYDKNDYRNHYNKYEYKSNYSDSSLNEQTENEKDYDGKDYRKPNRDQIGNYQSSRNYKEDLYDDDNDRYTHRSRTSANINASRRGFMR